MFYFRLAVIKDTDLTAYFSIITATRNSKSTLARTLESVVSQDFTDFEHIFVDGESDDGTIKDIEAYCHMNGGQFFIKSPNGIYDALNYGLEKASGKYIIFLHSDDRFASSDVLSSLYEVLDRSNPTLLYGDINYVRKENPTVLYRRWVSGEFSKSMVYGGWMPPHTASVILRTVYNVMNGFDTSYQISADYDFLLKVLISDEYSVEYTPVLVTEMMVGGESNRSIKTILKKMSEDYAIMRRNNLCGLYTLACKNLRKLNQFWKKK